MNGGKSKTHCNQNGVKHMGIPGKMQWQKFASDGIFFLCTNKLTTISMDVRLEIMIIKKKCRMKRRQEKLN